MRLLVAPTLAVSQLAAQAAAVDVSCPDEVLPVIERIRTIVLIYQLFFAGQPRSTRDIFRLRNLILNLGAARTQLGLKLRENSELPIAGHISMADRNIQLFVAEFENMSAALHRRGDAKSASYQIAHLINHQVALYEAHYVARPRASRILSLLRQIILNVESCITLSTSPRFSELPDFDRHASNTLLAERIHKKLTDEYNTLVDTHLRLRLMDRVLALNAESCELLAETTTVVSQGTKAPEEIKYLYDRTAELQQSVHRLLQQVHHPIVAQCSTTARDTLRQLSDFVEASLAPSS